MWPTPSRRTNCITYQAVLDKKLKGTSFDDDMTCAFCRIWPNLHPVSGGVQHVNRAHPVWDVLLRVHGVNTIPRFLRHLFTKHDGEAGRRD